jgi:hypothetical protein
MSTSDIMIIMAPFGVLWLIMAIGFITVHILDMKGN